MSGFRFDSKKDDSLILPVGIDISVPQCSMEDINWVLSGTIKNQMIKMISSAIEAAEWFKGVWYVKENGALVRPYEHTTPKDLVEFKQVSLNPIDPQTNTSALTVFRKIQKEELSCNDEMSTIVSLDTSQRIMADKDGFCLWEVRQEYDGAKTILP
jgi:hypothetical protein